MQLTVLTLAGVLASAAAVCNEKKIVCYVFSSGAHSQSKNSFDINQFDPYLCTHLIYGRVTLSNNGSIQSSHPKEDLSCSEQDGGLHGFFKINRLRGLNSKLKTLVLLVVADSKFSKATNSAGSRAVLVENALKFVRKYGFDGLAFHWDYPENEGGVVTVNQNHVLTLKIFKQRFDEEGLILSVLLDPPELKSTKSNIISEIVKYSHFVNLQMWDMHVFWDKKTGIIAPVYAGSWESGDERLLNVNASVNYLISQGTPAEKLILGIPAFGNTFTLDDPNNNGIGAPAQKLGNAGSYYGNGRWQAYHEICEAQLAGGWQVKFQEEQRVPYAFKGDQWVGYENPQSIREKAALIGELGLGGALIFTLDYDDWRGACGEKYPLLKTVNRALRGGSLSL